MVKFGVYASASLLACAGLLYYTYITRMQFYPAVIYLVTSKISVLILGNAGLVLTILFARLVKSIFLGVLRDAEVELLHENVRYAITETCLALTIFRDEINFHVVVLFTSLVFLKVFHWLAQSRIEFIEQSDVISRLTHVRLVTLMAGLAAVDLSLVVVCGLNVLDAGPSVFILFGFEFLILSITLVATFLRYVLYVIDTRLEGNWPNKFTYLFYLELVSEIVKLVVYLVFFLLIFSYYGMPLHIVRDLWVSIKNLQRRIASYFRYRKITAHLNDRFPNPTEEELEATDRTCIICREEMSSDTCKKLPCSHIFHVDCLKMWVQRQQTCPTCRSTIPTGPRPPAVPETPVAAGAAVEPAVAPAEAGGAVPPAVPPAPAVAAPFHFGRAGGIPGVAAAPPGAAPAPSGVTQPAGAAAAAAAAPAHGAAVPPPAGVPPLHYGAGYPPFMPPPFMFAPGMAAPFGYGMTGAFGMSGGAPLPFGYPFGMPIGMPPGAGGPVPQAPVPVMDPETIQRQIELLHAQLAMLQAATGYGVHAPATPAAPPAQPQPTTPMTAPATPAPATPHASSNETDEGAADLEEKRPVPATAAATVAGAGESAASVPVAPVELRVPPAPQTEAERRRDELRRRYNRIYTSTTSSAAPGATDDEAKSD